MTRRAEARPRIPSADAVLVRSRVETAAESLGLRCGLLAVLTAVLALLVGYKRLRDDQVAIRHITARFPTGARSLSATTIGRRLSQLHALELIVYEPARGRGRTAHLAIHPRFCEGVSELSRDRNGKVIAPARATATPPHGGAHTPVNAAANPDSHGPAATRPEEQNVEFSSRPFLLKRFPRKTPPLTSAIDASSDGRCGPRPIEVDVESGAVNRVLAKLPDCYRKVPWAVRQHLHRAIRTQLARGWREEQIIEVLAAPLPEQVRKPLVLARLRFAKSLIGPGPRLRPLQRSWDRAAAAARQADWAASLTSRYAAIVAEVGPSLAQRMAIADRYRTSGITVAAGALDETAQQRATVNAARAVRREYPHESLPVATRRWLTVHEPTPQLPVQTPAAAPAGDLWAAIEELAAAVPVGQCVCCGTSGASTREELPAPAPVCDGCWELVSTDDDDPTSGSPAPTAGQLTDQTGGMLLMS